MLDFSLHAYKDATTTTFEKTHHLLHGKNSLQVSSSFFNSQVGKWEPIIEKWAFNLEFEIGEMADFKKKLSISSSDQEPLNINVSDEMVI